MPLARKYGISLNNSTRLIAGSRTIINQIDSCDYFSLIIYKILIITIESSCGIYGPHCHFLRTHIFWLRRWSVLQGFFILDVKFIKLLSCVWLAVDPVYILRSTRNSFCGTIVELCGVSEVAVCGIEDDHSADHFISVDEDSLPVLDLVSTALIVDCHMPFKEVAGFIVGSWSRISNFAIPSQIGRLSYWRNGIW